MSIPEIVLDTNVVLDLLLFADPATPPLRKALDEKQVQWIATPVMREELKRVLAYPHIAARMAFYERSAEDILKAFDAQTRIVEVSPKAPHTCTDPDDQKFIDLAFEHTALLISKDKAVLKLKKRLAVHGVTVATHYGPVVAVGTTTSVT